MSPDRLDLVPAARRMATSVEAVPDDALGRTTPCEAYTVGDLLDHIGGFAPAFAAAAAKTPLEGGPAGDAANLGPDWRSRIPRDLEALATAWREPDAWTGMTRVGGVDLPGEIAGRVALDELVIHAWDLARGAGLPVPDPGPDAEPVFATVQEFRASGIEGPFGPPVPVAEDAPLFDRVLGLSGRDPAWRAPQR